MHRVYRDIISLPRICVKCVKMWVGIGKMKASRHIHQICTFIGSFVFFIQQQQSLSVPQLVVVVWKHKATNKFACLCVLHSLDEIMPSLLTVEIIVQVFHSKNKFQGIWYCVPELVILVSSDYLQECLLVTSWGTVALKLWPLII